jgi:hypothetical protein
MRLRRTLPLPAQRLSLGSALRVSPFCVGIVDSPATVAAAFDVGINFFFLSADMHWPLYEATRRGIRDLLRRRRSIRHELVIAGVSYVTQPEFCRMPFLEILDAVPGLERLDVLVAGGVYASDFDVRAPIYSRHRATALAGCTASGASFHDRRAARSALSEAQIDIGFVRYNPAHTGAEAEVYAGLRRRSRRLLYAFNSTRGRLGASELEHLPADCWLPGVTDYYRFALAPAAVDGLLCSFSTPREVEALAAAMQEPVLSSAEREHLVQLARFQQVAKQRGQPTGPRVVVSEAEPDRRPARRSRTGRGRSR